MMKMELIAITENGKLTKPVSATLSPLAADVIDATTQLYSRGRYEPPWIGYLAVENGICVGTCGFKSPPKNDRTEIAYFTFPGHESRGVATRMASDLNGINLAGTHFQKRSWNRRQVRSPCQVWKQRKNVIRKGKNGTNPNGGDGCFSVYAPLCAAFRKIFLAF
jgi:hypothetical protein